MEQTIFKSLKAEQIPNLKHQITNKYQSANYLKFKTAFEKLVINCVLILFVFCLLIFGI